MTEWTFTPTEWLLHPCEGRAELPYGEPDKDAIRVGIDNNGDGTFDNNGDNAFVKIMSRHGTVEVTPDKIPALCRLLEVARRTIAGAEAGDLCREVGAGKR